MLAANVEPETAPFIHYYFSPAPKAAADTFVKTYKPFIELVGGAIASSAIPTPEGEWLWGLRLMLPEPSTPRELRVLAEREWVEVPQPLVD